MICVCIPIRSIAYEEYILDNIILKKKVRKGTRKSQCSSFQTYIKDSLLRYDLIPNTNVKFTGDTNNAIIFARLI